MLRFGDLIRESGLSVVGLDVGQVKLGAAVICDGDCEAEAFSTYNGFKGRYLCFDYCMKWIKSKLYRIPDLVVIEDYLNRSQSFVAFGMGEFGGVIRTVLYEEGWPMLFCPPTYLRSFCGIGPRVKSLAGKHLTIEWVLNNFGITFGPGSSVGKKDAFTNQTNATDAFVYAVIGACCLLKIRSYYLEQKIFDIIKKKEKGILESLLDAKHRWTNMERVLNGER